MGNKDASDAPPSYKKLATRLKNDPIVKANGTGLSYKEEYQSYRDHIMDMEKRRMFNGYHELKARKELFLMAFLGGKPPA